MKKLLILFVAAILMAACSKPYVIVQIADAQLGFTADDKCKAEGRDFNDNVSYELEFLKKAVAKVNEIKPDAVVFTGDQVHHPNNLTEWSAFRTAVSAVSKDVKVFHLPGNHDVFIGENTVNMEPFEERFGKGSFVYEDGKVKLVGINTNYIKYNDPRENEQFEWLEGILGEKKGQTTLIFGHHPFFLENIEEEEGYFPIQKNKRKIYFDLFRRHGVDAVFAGHYHNNANGSYEGIPSYTATSISVQLGTAQQSIRVITIKKGVVTEEQIPLN